MVELLALPFSPWSEKAQWALDARGVKYRYRVYQPLLGEPELRLKLRRLRGPVTVPVLTDGSRVVADSTDIARWADEHGSGPTLFPAAHVEAIARLCDLSERALAAGRGLSLRRVRIDDEALAELVPKPLRRPLGRLGLRMARSGVERSLRKYGAAQIDADVHEQALTSVLDELRASLAAVDRSGPKTLLGRFSYADVAMAQALAYVEPPAFGLRLGRAARRSFQNPALKERYADLVAWRDDVYEAYRPK
jgi:glutathione S-transferase